MNSSRGFILVTVLIVLSVMAIGASFMALWVQQLRESAEAVKTQTNGMIDEQSTKATVLYLVATSGMNYGGLRIDGSSGIPTNSESMGEVSLIPLGSELALDDTAYNGIGIAQFSLQDEGGLFNANFFSAESMSSFLGYLGVNASSAKPMADKLLDYIDYDNIVRINGAEQGRYEQAKLLPPINRPLFDPLEARRAMDWIHVPELWGNNNFGLYTTTLVRGMPNVNTAPSAVLQSMPGIGKEEANKIIQARARHVINLAEQIEAIIGKPLKIPIDTVNRFTSRYLRLSIWNQNVGNLRQIHLELTPKTPTNIKPWLIHYERTIKNGSETHRQPSKSVENPLFKTVLSTN